MAVSVEVGVALGVAEGVGVDDRISTEFDSADRLFTTQRPLASVPWAEALKLTSPGISVSKT